MYRVAHEQDKKLSLRQFVKGCVTALLFDGIEPENIDAEALSSTDLRIIIDWIIKDQKIDLNYIFETFGYSEKDIFNYLTTFTKKSSFNAEVNLRILQSKMQGHLYDLIDKIIINILPECISEIEEKLKEDEKCGYIGK